MNAEPTLCADEKDKGLTLVPPPKQFCWISQNEGQDDSVSNYDFILLSSDGSGTVHENSVGNGLTRSVGRGFKADAPIKAMSATTEGIVFVSSGKDVYAYRKQGSGWQLDVSTNGLFRRARHVEGGRSNE